VSNDRPEAALPFPTRPGGTVTFLHTDIEGSTKLLKRLREEYADLLAGQHRSQIIAITP
jgi:class 3 adenylate cyclase